MQHSSGPWEVLSAEFKGGGVVAFEIKMPQPQLNFADKHLIESAHAMYEALKLVEESGFELNNPDNIEIVVVAIAKAEGRQ
jgi:hypothetical protein